MAMAELRGMLLPMRSRDPADRLNRDQNTGLTGVARGGADGHGRVERNAAPNAEQRSCRSPEQRPEYRSDECPQARTRKHASQGRVVTGTHAPVEAGYTTTRSELRAACPLSSNMARSKQRARTPSVEAALGLALGAVAGCLLGATENPVDQALSAMTAEGSLEPMLAELRNVGPLGLGTLLGATALTAAMTSVVAGVVMAAAVASAMLVAGGGSQTQPTGLWASAGLAGALGATLSGATAGVAVEWTVGALGGAGLLWVLGAFAVTKPALRFLLRVAWQQGEACRRQGSAAAAREREEREARERERVTVQMEERILELEGGGKEELRDTWERERRRVRAERARAEREEEEELEQRSLQDWVNAAVLKYLDVLAFSGAPATAIAVAMSALGAWGYGSHRAALPALVTSVALLSFWLLRAPRFKFWMLAGCMGLLATFVIAMLTLHVSQQGAAEAHEGGDAGGGGIAERGVALEAMGASFFVARLCQLGFGASVGGPLVRRGAGEAKVVAGAAAAAAVLLALAEVAAGELLGNGGRAGVLLGAVGAVGVSVGGAAAMATGWSSWAGTLGTLLGMVAGALVVGQGHLVNIGLQVPLAYVFAMTNPL